MQVVTSNGVYTPDWDADALVITPSVYLGKTWIPLSDENLSVSWRRKEGSGMETELAGGE